MRNTRISLAIATALLLSAPAIAQERDPAKGKAPSGPAPESSQGGAVLPGATCTGEGGSNCPTAVGSSSVTSSFEIQGCAEAGIINDVNVGLDISHTWVGDLKITLTSPAATSVVIMDQPGTVGEDEGCTSDDVYAVLDDSGTGPVEDACYDPPPAIAGNLVPNNPLAAFNGQDGGGAWSLEVEDIFTAVDGGTLNDWSLDLSCGDTTQSRATFRVTKDFTDDNPAEVNVKIDCNTGLILDQDKLISEGEYVEFVVTSFDNGEMNCTITEDVPAGYSPDYYSNGIDTVECSYEEVGFGSAHSCRIVNTPEPVTLTVNKTWLYPSSTFDTDEGFNLYFYCDTEIDGGYTYEGDSYWYQDVYGLEGDDSHSISVHPTWQGNTCWVYESPYSNFVEVDASDCQGVAIELGSDASCEVINTVFYEGIPTLSHYGIAVLALSLLGLGMVGFRRYS